MREKVSLSNRKRISLKTMLLFKYKISGHNEPQIKNEMVLVRRYIFFETLKWAIIVFKNLDGKVLKKE
jgi:hypothetical protein